MVNDNENTKEDPRENVPTGVTLPPDYPRLEDVKVETTLTGGAFYLTDAKKKELDAERVKQRAKENTDWDTAAADLRKAGLQEKTITRLLGARPGSEGITDLVN